MSIYVTLIYLDPGKSSKTMKHPLIFLLLFIATTVLPFHITIVCCLKSVSQSFTDAIDAATKDYLQISDWKDDVRQFGYYYVNFQKCS